MKNNKNTIKVELDICYLDEDGQKSDEELLVFIKQVTDSNCQFIVKSINGGGGGWPIINLIGEKKTIFKLLEDAGFDTTLEGEGWSII